MKDYRILLVDDHEMIRDGLRYMLEADPDEMKVDIDEAETGEQGANMALQGHYDLVLMDYQLPDIEGAAVVKRIIEEKPDMKILALSNYDEYAYITNMLNSGAKGFILKNVSPSELRKAVETVIAGKNFFSNEVALKLMQPHYRRVLEDESPKKVTTEEVSKILSKREIEILQYIAKEYTNEEIAQKLSISKRTVDTHRNNLIKKVGVKNTVGLVKFAIGNGVI